MTTFKEKCQQLTRNVGSWKTARDSMAVHMGVHRLEVTRMLAGMQRVDEAKLADIVERPAYPGYVTVATMAQHMNCSRQNAHQRIKHGSLTAPEHEEGREVWRGEEFRNIWEGVYHESTTPE